MRAYRFEGYAGCVVRRKARQTGTLVGVYHNAQAGTDIDPECPWSTLCEEHGAYVTHPTLERARAHASDPRGWCEECRETEDHDTDVMAKPRESEGV